MPRIVNIGKHWQIGIWHIYDLMLKHLAENNVNMYSEEYKAKQRAFNDNRGGNLNLLHNPPSDLAENHFLEDDEIESLHQHCVGLTFGYKNLVR